MKKVVLCTLLLIVSAVTGFAQTKFEYCDVYARGSWNNMRITITHKNGTQELYGNIGTVLNELSELGWVLDESIVIPRHGIPVTRHKIHLIMKKEVPNSATIQNPSNIAISDNNVQISSTTLMDKFSNGEISKLDKASANKVVMEFIDEISSELKNVSTEEDMLVIDKKIQTVEKYSSNLPKKNFSITDKVTILKNDFNHKAKKMGISLRHH